MSEVTFKVDAGQTAYVAIYGDPADRYIVQWAIPNPEDECEDLWVDYSPDDCVWYLDNKTNPMTFKIPGRYRLLPDGVFVGVKAPVVSLQYR